MCLLFLENLILTALRLRGRSSHTGQPVSLGHQFLVLFFGLLHSLRQELSISCGLLLFLVRRFFRTIHGYLCCRTHGVTRHSILGASVLDFLPSLFRGFLTT